MNKEQTVSYPSLIITHKVQDHLVNMAWGKIDEKNPN